MGELIFDLEKYEACARKVIAEGAVLLKNDGKALPLKDGSEISIFGRSQFHYYKSGSGSGGMVNAAHVVSIPEALEESGKYILNNEICTAYKNWLTEHPYDTGDGWGGEPWYQQEMPLDEALVRRAAESSEVALVVIGRLSGEDNDNQAEHGSYLLTMPEEDMLDKVCSIFKKSIVLLNVGNIIDMKWVEKYEPSAVLYVWQGGQAGGYGVLDVLNGTVTPCGKLADTIAMDIEDYPSTANYGSADQNIYEEDIYIGYRYFETFQPRRVLYPFGYGLSYTEFALENIKVEEKGAVTGSTVIDVSVTIKNIGNTHGKEVVQVYVKKPMGMLGQPARSLCGYAKTRDLQPGEDEDIHISFDWYTVSSYDDSGCTGNKSCYVLEKGDYEFYVGSDVRNAKMAAMIPVDEMVIIQRLEEVMAPVVAASRIHPILDQETGIYKVFKEPMPSQTINPMIRRKERIPEEVGYTGDQGFKLADVRDGKVTMGAFIAQLTDEDLCALMRGEGMGSPKVTPGTGGAFGGVTDRLYSYGIPIGCCSDGPSGIRMDCGTKAFAMPNGTCMACSFNDELVRELYEWEGLELRKNKVDVLLGPGMNIHRNPLNGRNFEYFSEDPLLSGKMAAAQLNGMHKYNTTGTIKHFACNNQEYKRNFVNGVISERALREIYLKGFEIAVKEAGAYCIMSTYGPVNGIYTAGNYDLLTTVLRGEWGFKGIVMTDWWAKANEENGAGDTKNTAQMARAQNDLYMVVKDAASNSGGDHSLDGIKNGTVSRAEFQRNAANICEALLKMPAFQHYMGIEDELERKLKECLSVEDEAFANVHIIEIGDGISYIDPSFIHTERGAVNLFQVFTKPRGIYKLSITCKADVENDLAQIPLSVFQGKKLTAMINLTGENTDDQVFHMTLDPKFRGDFYMKLYFAQSGMIISKCTFELVKSMEEEFIEVALKEGII